MENQIVTDRYRLILGDSAAVLAELGESSIDAVVTDPPYGLTITKRFKKACAADAEKAAAGRDQYARLTRGFLNQEWDGTGIENNPEFWAAVMRVLKPGGHLLAFSGTRTYHRMTSAIEESGFEIRDMISWLYSSGFPKSHDIGKQLEKRGAGAEFRGWGTALKPAVEPIVLARKPIKGTIAGNVLSWRTGALNIDAARIRAITPIKINRLEKWTGFGQLRKPEYTSVESNSGRWPANVLLDSGAAELLDQASGITAGRETGYDTRPGRNDNPTNVTKNMRSGVHFGDSGGASRFFYVAKASAAERNEGLTDGLRRRANIHPTVKPVSLMTYLIKLITPPGGIVLDPFAGSGSTGCAAVMNGFRFCGIERQPEYYDIARARLAHWIRKYQLSLFEQG